MSEGIKRDLSGGCLCGAVRFTALGVPDELAACHCDTCRRWSGSPMIAVHPEKGVRIDAGEDRLRWYDSSDWAERGFCTTCGTSLFYRLKGDGTTVPSAGAFDDQNAFSGLTSEFFVDEQPGYYAFAGDRPRLTGAEVVALFGGTPAEEE